MHPNKCCSCCACCPTTRLSISMCIFNIGMSEAMSKLSLETKIKLKYKDWEVEITCTEDKVKSVVENVLTGIDIASLAGSDTNTNKEIERLRIELDNLKSRIENNIDGALSSNNQRRNGISLKELAKNGNTCRSLIEKMFYEKFFESERLLIEVHQELSKMGYNYDKTAVSHSLSDMVREGILSRVGTLRNYRYIQKKPLFEK